MYKIETEQFMLDLTPVVHKEDLEYPVNTSLMVKVFSYDFSAYSLIDADVRDIGKFAIDLNNLYDSLEGAAKLIAPYGDSRIDFTVTTGGHIKISGCIDNENRFGYTQKLFFENEIDQTYLRDFSKALYSDYKKYATDKLGETR